MTTKIHALCDALANPLRLVLTAGECADRPQAERLLDGLPADALIADKGYDCDRLCTWCEQRGITPVIPSRRNRRMQRVIDRNLCKDRNKIERFFSLLKHYRRVATRYDKTADSFLAFCHLAAAAILLR